ncbi:Myosin light chain kinase, smooth muscle [Eufriesea mexicana]|nr:Myosin light chain kinase, smooth muscle [Eufriesea mexicana]
MWFKRSPGAICARLTEPEVHVVGKGSREGSLKPADSLTPSGPLPVFTKGLQDECCRIGDTLRLSCQVQVPPWPKGITWYNKEGRIEPNEKYHVMEDGLGGYFIAVNPVEAMDEGEWKCVATSAEDMKQFTTCYVAMSIPKNYRKPRFMESLKAVLTEEGLVSFECKVVGFPTPLLRWFKDGQELKPGDVYQLTGTNSLGSYCCIARNCMGEARSTAELTIEDIQNQLNEEEVRISRPFSSKVLEAARRGSTKIFDLRYKPSIAWYRDDMPVDENEKYQVAKENLGTCHLDVQKLEFADQAEWKCVASNDHGQSVTSCFLKLIIPKHYKKPKFLEGLRAILSDEGAVNLECKVIGVPQPILKWYKDGVELKPGDIHRIISGQDGTCCLGTYTCEATNCMGTVSSSASLLGFEDKLPVQKEIKEPQSPNGHELARNLSLSTIHEERTSQLYDTPQTDHSVTLDDRGEVSFSFDGKEVSVSLYETPDLTEEEALQIVEMYADQLSEHVTEHNVIELPPMRFVKESSNSGNLLMEAVVIDVSPDYFVSAEDGDDLRTEADFEDVSIMDDITRVLSSPEHDSRSSLKRSAAYSLDEDEKPPTRPPRKKSSSSSKSEKSEKSQKIESESFHSAQRDEPFSPGSPMSPVSSLKQDDSDTFADALSSARLSISENQVQKIYEDDRERKRSFSGEKTAGSSIDDGIGGDSSFDSVTGVAKKKKHRKKKHKREKGSSEESSIGSEIDGKRKGSGSESANTEMLQRIESINKTEEPYVEDVADKSSERKQTTSESEKSLTKSNKERVKKTVEEQRSAVEEPKQDTLKEVRLTLQEALKSYENVAGTLDPRLSTIFDRVDEMYRRLRTPQKRETSVELLMNLEGPLYSLQCALTSVPIADNDKQVFKLLEPALSQLKAAITNLNESSLQPMLEMVRNIEMIVGGPEKEVEETSSKSTTQEEAQNLTERILDSLIDVQSALSTALQNIEEVESVTNGATSSQKLLASSEIAACLVELRQYVSDTAHTAMTLREDETLNSLMDLKEPLMELQRTLASKGRTIQELPVIRKISVPVEKLKVVVSKVMHHCESQETLKSITELRKMMEDIEIQVPKTVAQLIEADEATKHYLENLNVDQNLSNVHFALSSTLERHERSFPSFTSSLTICVEDLRQNIGSSAVAIANLKNPIDEQIIGQIYLLKESLLSLQRSLLTQEHEPEEEQILKDLIIPIEKLKVLVQSMVNSDAKTDTILPVLELLEEIEKDTPLIAKEASKKKARREAEKLIPKEEESKRQKVQTFGLADRISRSLDPMKHWLSTTSEDSMKDEEESGLSSTVDELKRDVNKIAIETSYSEPPSDENLIEALVDLREPLLRLRNAISMYHEPADLTTLEDLGRPMKYLVQTIMDILRDHTEEESLKPIVDIVEEIENQIPISIKEALYRKELKEMETILQEKELVTAHTSQETIPEGTLMESTTLLPETQFAQSIVEQTTVDDVSSQRTEQLVTTIEELPKSKEDVEKMKKEQEAKSLIISLSKTLESVGLDIAGILEDFEEPTAGITAIPVSILANSLEELRKTIFMMRMATGTYGGSVESYEEVVSQTVSMLQNLLQPLNDLQIVLQQSHQHGAHELLILNHLIQPLNAIESDVVNHAIQKLGQNPELKKNCEPIFNLLRDIKDIVPIVVKDIHSRQELLGSLREISKPLENIEERMKMLEIQDEETLETDVARILVQPFDYLLNTIKVTSQEVQLLDQRRAIVVELQSLAEPLVEFLSSLSVVQSSRKSLVPEAALLDERRNVISKSVEGLQRQTSTVLERISNLEGATLFEEALIPLKNATVSVQKQIGKTDYSRRSSSAEFSLHYNLSMSFDHLKNTIATLEEKVEKPIKEVISKSLEALQKQITLSQTYFMQTYNEQAIDEEVIVEGFLYPTNQLRSALNTLKEKIDQKAIPSVSVQFVTLLQALASSTTELATSLSLHRVQLIREGASDGSSLVETLTAMVDVLESVKESITEIERVADVKKIEEKEEKKEDKKGEDEIISSGVPITITQIETIIDEIIEVSKEEVESVLTIEKVSPERELEKIKEKKLEKIDEEKSVLKDIEDILIKESGMKGTEKLEIFEGMKEVKPPEVTKTDEKDVVLVGKKKEEEIKAPEVKKEEKAAVVKEMKEALVESLEEMAEEKVKALEVSKEERVEVSELIKEERAGAAELTTQEKIEVLEEQRKALEAIKEEKVEILPEMKEETIETLEGMKAEGAKAVEIIKEDEALAKKVEALEIIQEGKADSLAVSKEEKVEIVEEKEKEEASVSEIKKGENVEEIKVGIVESLEGMEEEKAGDLTTMKQEAAEAVLKTTEQLLTAEGKPEVVSEIAEVAKKEEEKVVDKTATEISEIKEEKIEEQVQREKAAELSKADELPKEALKVETSEKAAEVVKGEEKEKETLEIKTKEHSTDVISAKVEEKVDTIQEETKEIAKKKESVEKSEEVMQKESKAEKAEDTIKKEESVQILAEKTEELIITEEKVESLPETTKELAKGVEKVEISLEEAAIKEEKPEIKSAQAEEKSKELIRKEEQMETLAKRSEEVSKIEESKEEIEKKPEKVEEAAKEKKMAEKSEEPTEVVEKEETTDITSKESGEAVRQEETIEVLSQKVDEFAIKEEKSKEDSKQVKINLVQKTASSINTMQQPFKDLTNLLTVALEEPLTSKSEEEKRRLRELTALIQILYDLKATNISIKNTLSSSSIPELQTQFLRLLDSLINVDQATEKVLCLTQKDLAPALKENVMVSLQMLLEPLESLLRELSSIQQTATQLSSEYFPLSTNTQSINETITELVKVIRKTAELKRMKVVEEIKEMATKSRKQSLDIEETTAKPLEELMEVLIASQEQIKPDETAPLDLVPPTLESAKMVEQEKLIGAEEIKLETELVTKIVSPIQNLREMVAKIEEQKLEETEALDLSTMKTAAAILSSIMHPLEELEQSLNISAQQQTIEIKEVAEEMEQHGPPLQSLPVANALNELMRSIATIQEEVILEASEEVKTSESKASVVKEVEQSLENLKFSVGAVQKMVTTETEKMKDVQSSVKMNVEPVLEQLQKSIAVIQEQVSLEPSKGESREKLESSVAKAIEEPLEHLKTSVAAVREIMCEETEQTADLSNADRTSILQSFAKSVEEIEERCSAVISQQKTETKLKEAEKQQAKMVEQAGVNLNILIEPLNVLEQALLTAVQEGKVMEEETAKDLKKSEVSMEKLNLQPVLEELQKSITIIQQQTSESASASAEISEVSLVKAAEKSLEEMKISLAAVQEIATSQQDQAKELRTGEEKSRMEAFAQSVEEVGEKLLAVVKQQEVRKATEVLTKKKVKEDFVKTVIEPINELQDTILSMDKESELLGKKKEQEAVVLTSMVQPLQKLQKSLLSAMQVESTTEYETVKDISHAIPALQELPVKPALEELNENVAEIQKQLILAKEMLSSTGDSEDFAAIKNLEGALSDLRTSVAIVQQLTMIEKADQQILDVENTSALQTFGKAAEEFKKQCSIVISRPKVMATIIGKIQLEQPTKLQAQVSESVLVPAKLLQESISTIEEIKLQEAEVLQTSETKKPVTVLSELIPPLQRLEQSFVAAIQGEHVMEQATENLEADQVPFEKATLKPILEEFQKSIAAIQEHMMIEEGVQNLSEVEDASQLKTMAQTLTDLRTSVAAIQQATESVPEVANELSKKESVSAFETFAKSLHDLVERVATIDHQQMVIEPAADTISEDVSSLKTWAEVVEEQSVQITKPMIVDQGTIESPSEMALSISEEEAQVLKGLAKPLSELKECLAIVVEERKSIDANEVALALSVKEDLSLLKTMAQPLLELKNAAVSVIHEQTAIESAKEKSFDTEERTEATLNPLIEPLEELCNSIAIIEDRMLIESTEDRAVEEISLLAALAEPLMTLHRSISVLEERVMSPDVESIPEESMSWITECLAVPLQEIERSIAEIRECVIVEPALGIAEELSRIATPDWSVVEKLVEPVEVIRSTIIEMEGSIIGSKKAIEDIEYETVKTLVQPLTEVHESFLALKDKPEMSIDEEEASIDAIVDSLSNLEKSISFIEEQAAEKVHMTTSIEETIIGVLVESLTQLKEKIMTVEESPTVYLENLEKPLKEVQAALEVAATVQLEIQNEKEALKTLVKPLEQLQQGIQSVLEKAEIEEASVNSLKELQKTIATVRQQFVDKPASESPQSEPVNVVGILKSVMPSLNELEGSTEKAETLWKESLSGEGLMELETPISNLMNADEEERVRRRHEEEASRLRQRRQDQIRDSTWSRMRQSESDQLFRKMADDALRIGGRTKPISYDVEFWRDKRDKSYRYDSGFDSALSSTSRSYSWRDSLTSLTRKRIDDFLDYKLRDTSIDRYYFDTGSYYRRRRKRDDQITRARSISLLKYDDYSTGDSDSTITPASVSKPPRYSNRLKTSSRTDLDDRGSNLSIYLPPIKDELTPRDKGKKPSFCTRLTNRTVGVGMRTRLTCTVLGYPEPRVYWTRDGEKLDVTANRYKTRFDNGMAYFELHEALPEDSGLYTCVAENVHGIATTESTLKVYPDFQPALSPPTFTKSIKDTYRPSDNELILECRVRGHPVPIISWLKDGCILQGDRYKQCYLDDGIYRLEIAAPNSTDNGRYTCRAMNDLRTEEISHIVQFNERERRIVGKRDKLLDDYLSTETYKRPRFSSYLSDYSVPTGGTIALQVEVKGVPAPEVRWFRGERREPVSIPKAKTFTESGVHTLVLPEVTESERGTYICRAINAYGHVDSIATVDVISPSAIDGGKPAMFVSRPMEKSITVTAGEDVSVSFRATGVPKPRVTWMKGLRDITDGPRSHKETIDDYVRLTLKRVVPSDEGTYCILVKNRYGCDRTFFSIKVKQRARSLTPDWSSMSSRTETGSLIGLSSESRDDELSYVKTIIIRVKQRARSLTPDWSSMSSRTETGSLIGLSSESRDDELSYVKRNFHENLCTNGMKWKENVPGPITSEPVVINGGKNWLSLSWGKAERRGPAPVIAYRVDAWMLGSDGGARWVEVLWISFVILSVYEFLRSRVANDQKSKLGMTPINAFDAFNLKPGGEYKFQVTPRNRYGWGESVTMTNSVKVSETVDLPEFTRILPGQLKVLEGATVKLECEIRADSKVDIKWYHESTEIDPSIDARCSISRSGSRCCFTIEKIQEIDSGRYVCEASNSVGKVSSFARVLVVNDPKIIEADEKLKSRALGDETEDRPPQFTMRIRDRRVQASYPVRLTCQLTGYPTPEVTWYKDGVEIRQDERHVFWNNDSNFYTLEIIHSMLEDSGCYMVTAKNTNGSVSCRCNLVVDKGIRAYIAPEFLCGLDCAYTVKLGGELRMTAQIEAYPSVGIVWHRDGIRLRPSRRAVMTLDHDGTIELCLAKVTARDAGVYCCTATNEVGCAETSTRVAIIGTETQDDEVSVEGVPTVTIASTPDIPYSKEPLFVTKPLSTEAIEGDTVIISCEVVGDPKPEVMWLRDFLRPDYYRDAAHFRLVGEGPQYRLEIPYAKLDFTGTYSVIARNCHGEAKAVISLQIYAKGQGKEEKMKKSGVIHGKVLTLPVVTRELRDLRCCDGDAVTLECKVHATPEAPLVRWERGGKIIQMGGDFSAEFDGETARLCIQHVYPEDEGEYTCVAYNDLGKAFTSACLIVDVPEGKENVLSQRLTRPAGLLSAGSTPRSTPRSTPIRSLSPAVSHGRELRSPQLLPRSRSMSRRPKISPPKFYAVPHNRVVEEGETVRFQCAVIGHPTPWVKWDKNGMIVTPTARISIKERDDVKILEIVEVTQEDAGLYRVIVENDYGRIEASARLEIINRQLLGTVARSIRTRSASPRTYPSFSRSLLDTTSRINGRLYLDCCVRGSPSPTPTWFRNGRPLERSIRIKRYFDGKTAKVEISKVKASDAGEYTCVATNVLGSTKNTCQVTVLDPYCPSTCDKESPKFLQSLPAESIVMEGHCYELQTRLAGTPPFSVTWLKDGREIPDNDYCKYVIYGDGGVALRLSNVCPQDAGEYTCLVRNNFGEASSNGLFVVQDYKGIPKLAPQFTKTPQSVVTSKGETACFCTRVQCGKPMEITWTINGKDVRENSRCKVEKDDNVSILRIHDVQPRDVGEIRCTASMAGKGPSISCTAELRLNRTMDHFEESKHRNTSTEIRNEKPPKGPNCTRNSSLQKNIRDGPSLLPRRYESPSQTRASSLPVRCTPSPRQPSPLTARKNIPPSPLLDTKKAVINKTNKRKDLSSKKLVRKVTQRVYRKPNEERTSSSDEEADTKRSQDNCNKYDDTPIICMERAPEETEEEEPSVAPKSDEDVTKEEKVGTRSEEFVAAGIVKVPADVTVFRGNRVVLRVTYRGHPEPRVKWLRAGRELTPNKKTAITYGGGVSCLVSDDVTADNAGKYEVSVENKLGKDRRCFSVAVEGPPDPPAGIPTICCSTGAATINWRSSPYDGGCTVTGYTVEMNRAGENTWMTIAESCLSLSLTVPALETDAVIPGERYRFRVRAENIHGVSEPGDESEFVRIPKEGETCLQDDEGEFVPPFEARIVEMEDGQLFNDRYEVLEELGKGRYGTVRRVIEKSSDTSFAAKFVRTIKTKDRAQVREEIRIMNMLRHPKLLLLAAAFESPREIVMVTEYISGGELFERVVADDFTLTERDSILFMRQICEGVEYMHQNKVVHLDLKPENIMCRTRTSHQIKLIDFGLAQTLKPDTPIRVLFGTPEFIPPEIISYEPIGTESDMWSVGVICYVLLTGLSPFMGDNDAETFANITRADYDLEDEAFDAISNDAKDFISGLLVKRKESRMSARECLEHPWMAQHAEAMSRIALPTEKLKKFIVRRKWQKTGNAIRALGRMAILSANSRRSPTATAESSPTSDPPNPIDSAARSIDFEASPEEQKLCDIENIIEKNGTSPTELDTREGNAYSFCYKTETNLLPDETLDSHVKEETSLLSDLDESLKNEPTTDHAGSCSPRNESGGTLETDTTEEAEVQIVVEIEKELKDKMDQEAKVNSQKSRRVFRGDSRDSGIGDCISNLSTSSQQVNELGISAIKEEEVDNENNSGNLKSVLQKVEQFENRRTSLEEMNETSNNAGNVEVSDPKKHTKGNIEVATLSGVTKASRDINRQSEVSSEIEDPRLLIGRIRSKFVPTGNVSRTAKLFEKEAAASKSPTNVSQVSQRAFPAVPMTAGKPHNERIQKAFAFWNK